MIGFLFSIAIWASERAVGYFLGESSQAVSNHYSESGSFLLAFRITVQDKFCVKQLLQENYGWQTIDLIFGALPGKA
jgi:hypothetical protein